MPLWGHLGWTVGHGRTAKTGKFDFSLPFDIFPPASNHLSLQLQALFRVFTCQFPMSNFVHILIDAFWVGERWMSNVFGSNDFYFNSPNMFSTAEDSDGGDNVDDDDDDLTSIVVNPVLAIILLLLIAILAAPTRPGDQWSSSSFIIIICHLSIRMILMISGTCIGMRILHRDQRHTPRDHGSCSRNRPVSNAWWEHHDHHCFCQDYHHIIYI